MSKIKSLIEIAVLALTFIIASWCIIDGFIHPESFMRQLVFYFVISAIVVTIAIIDHFTKG